MNKTIEPARIYSSAEAAEFLDVKKITVNRLCKRGELKATKVRKWKIVGKSILEFCGSTAVK